MSFSGPITAIMNQISNQYSIQAPQYQRPAVIAKRLGLSKRTLFRWSASGKIPAYKLNSRVVMFDEAEINAFIKSSAT